MLGPDYDCISRVELSTAGFRGGADTFYPLSRRSGESSWPAAPEEYGAAAGLQEHDSFMPYSERTNCRACDVHLNITGQLREKALFSEGQCLPQWYGHNAILKGAMPADRQFRI
jgi:hypothetical protein